MQINVGTIERIVGEIADEPNYAAAIAVLK